MTPGEWLYLGLVLVTFVCFSAVLAYYSWVQSRNDGTRQQLISQAPKSRLLPSDKSPREPVKVPN